MKQYFFLVYFRSKGPHLFFTLPVLITAADQDTAKKLSDELVNQITSQNDLVLSPSEPLAYNQSRHELFIKSLLVSKPVPITVSPPLSKSLSQPDRPSLVVNVAVLDATANVAPCYALP